MIEGIVGYPGQGKNLFMVWLMQKHHFRMPDRAIYANFRTNLPYVAQINTLADIMVLDNCDVFLDEIYMWMPARGSQHQNKLDELSMFTQHRHHGIDMYWAAQEVNMVDVYLRDYLTTYVWRVNRPFGPDKITKDWGWLEKKWPWGPVSVAKRYEMALYLTPTKRTCLDTEWYRHQPLYPLYDTNWNVGRKNGEGAGSGRSQHHQACEDDARPAMIAPPPLSVYQARREVVVHEGVMPGSIVRCPPALEDVIYRPSHAPLDVPDYAARLADVKDRRSHMLKEMMDAFGYEAPALHYRPDPATTEGDGS